jgi:hypothetical protein
MPFKARLGSGEPRKREKLEYRVANAREYNRSPKRRGQLKSLAVGHGFSVGDFHWRHHLVLKAFNHLYERPQGGPVAAYQYAVACQYARQYQVRPCRMHTDCRIPNRFTTWQ